MNFLILLSAIFVATFTSQNSFAQNIFTVCQSKGEQFRELKNGRANLTIKCQGAVATDLTVERNDSKYKFSASIWGSKFHKRASLRRCDSENNCPVVASLTYEKGVLQGPAVIKLEGGQELRTSFDSGTIHGNATVTSVEGDSILNFDHGVLLNPSEGATNIVASFILRDAALTHLQILFKFSPGELSALGLDKFQPVAPKQEYTLSGFAKLKFKGDERLVYDRGLLKSNTVPNEDSVAQTTEYLNGAPTVSDDSGEVQIAAAGGGPDPVELAKSLPFTGLLGIGLGYGKEFVYSGELAVYHTPVYEFRGPGARLMVSNQAWSVDALYAKTYFVGFAYGSAGFVHEYDEGNSAQVSAGIGILYAVLYAKKIFRDGDGNLEMGITFRLPVF